NAQLSHRVLKKTTVPAKYIENIIDLQLKVDILETILKEESSAHGEIEEKALCLSRDLKSTEEKYLLLTNKYNGLNNEIEEAKSVIEALETQQLMSINELEDLRNSSNRYAQELHEKELMITSMNKKILNKKLADLLPHSYEEEKLSKMKESLEKSRRTNKLYKTKRVQEQKFIVYSSDEELSIRLEKTQEKQTTTATITANSTTELKAKL
ncbi:hypothetical protein Tco_0094650, partial [Tanacetum coccineum]